MNRITRLVFFSIALVCAFAISFVVYKKMTTPTGTVVRDTGQATAKIAVAVKDLGRGDKITAADIKMAPYLQETLPVGHFTVLEQSVDRVVLLPITASQPILESDLAPRELTKGGMASVINPQKRAMAVKVDNVIGVAGFLHPGHLVDVLVSVDPKKDDTHTQVTKTVLENIPVLSIGTQAQESEDKKAKQVTVVTLEVSLEEGEKLSLAVNQGSIHLALRNYTDVQPVLTKGITVASLLKSYTPETFEPVKTVAAEPSFRPVSRPARPQTVIKVMNGNKVETVTLTR